MKDNRIGERAEGTAISPTPATTQGRKVRVYQTPRPEGRRFRFVPQIKLSGDWLREAGFEIGDLITVVTAGPYLQIIRTVTANQEKQWNKQR